MEEPSDDISLPQPTKTESAFSEMTLKFLFVVFLSLNLLNNVDHGVLPAGSLIIKDDLNLNNLQFGLIGSSVFAGLTVGKPHSFD